jgi:hypothetical protein
MMLDFTMTLEGIGITWGAILFYQSHSCQARKHVPCFILAIDPNEAVNEKRQRVGK